MFLMGHRVMMGKPQRSTIGGTAKAGFLRGGCRWGERRQPHIILANMRIGAGIGDLMLFATSKRPHRCGVGFQKLCILVK